MSVLIGVSLALVVGIMATWTGLDRGRSFYATVTMVVASFYVLFAVMGGPSAPLLTECAVMGVFVVAAIAGFKKTGWLLVAALAGHGVFDIVVHPHCIANPGVPEWWPDFCSSYDLAAALYLAALLTRPMLAASSKRGRQAASTQRG